MYARFAQVPPERAIESSLSIARLVRHLERFHKKEDIAVARFRPTAAPWKREDGVLITDKKCIWRVPLVPEIEHFCPFDQPGVSDIRTFRAGSFAHEHGGPDMLGLWQRENAKTFRTLLLTPELRELPGMRNKPGQLLRRLWFPLDDEPTPETHWQALYMEKSYLDLFAVDLDELAGFRFETTRIPAPVRISSRIGICALLMPVALKSEQERRYDAWTPLVTAREFHVEQAVRLVSQPA